MSARRLEGATALVTGAGRGIGRAIALRYAAEGARVAVLGRSERSVAEAVGEIAFGGGKARHYVCDVRDPAALERACERAASDLGPLRVVVANAGVSRRTELLTAPPELVREVVETNLLGALWTFRAALPHVEKSAPGGGRFIALASALERSGAPGYGAYCASKHGVVGLVRALALELAPTGITVNAICPGWTDTDMATADLRDIAAAEGITEAEARARAESQQPRKRFATPEEVAHVAALLADPESRSITARVYAVDDDATPL